LIILGTSDDYELSRVTSAETYLGGLRFKGNYELETGVTRWTWTCWRHFTEKIPSTW